MSMMMKVNGIDFVRHVTGSDWGATIPVAGMECIVWLNLQKGETKEDADVWFGGILLKGKTKLDPDSGQVYLFECQDMDPRLTPEDCVKGLLEKLHAIVTAINWQRSDPDGMLGKPVGGKLPL